MEADAKPTDSMVKGNDPLSGGDLVYKLLSNRSQLYIRIGEYEKALADANKCIKLASDHWKAYRSKAYAIICSWSARALSCL
jgi:tetratricopeptide (TPR) repeat protein